MTDTIEILRLRMEAAAAALDFEEARRLRDRINLMRGGATADEAMRADTSGLSRQRPGAMGLGSGRGIAETAPDRTLPKKPDFLAGTGRRSRKPVS